LEERFQKLTAEMSEEKEAALPERWREIEEKIIWNRGQEQGEKEEARFREGDSVHTL
jgi:hypothetical protein